MIRINEGIRLGMGNALNMGKVCQTKGETKQQQSQFNRKEEMGNLAGIKEGTGID